MVGASVRNWVRDQIEIDAQSSKLYERLLNIAIDPM